MIPFYEWFNKIILTSANSVPIQSLWVAFFSNPFVLNNAFNAGNYENGYGYYSLIAGAATNTTQSVFGALFANSVTIPSDGMNSYKIGPEGMGLIKGSVSSGRRDMENLRISFLDTNMSFTDYNLRPWAIYASHKSLKDTSIKTTITIMQLAKAGAGVPLIPRAIWTFHDACPVNIVSEDFNYGSDNVVKREVEFAYNYYLLNADPGITAAQTIASVLDNSAENMTYQPTEIDPGGLKTHGSNQLITTPKNIPNINSHTNNQLVNVNKNDILERSVSFGLDILNNKNTNIQLKTNDAIDRLKSEGEALLNQIKTKTNDTPNHNIGTNQIGYEHKQISTNDNVSHNSPNRSISGKIGFNGNSKDALKNVVDTPLFFPGDGNENKKNISGNKVGENLDTPTANTINNQKVNIKRTGDVSKNIKVQVVKIKGDK